MKNNSLIQKLYTKFNVGILAILVGLATLKFIYFLGFILGPILFLGGIYSVILSDKPIWLKSIIIGLAIAASLIIFEIIKL